MTDDHDQIDRWLERDITPLMPRQGTLDRIRRTARRRKTTQAVMTAAGCAVVIAAVAVVPQLVHPSANTVANHSTTPATHSQTSTPPATPSTKPSSPRPRASASTTTSGTTITDGGQVPAIFNPTSVTFVGNGTGGVIGAVIGQGSTKTGQCATQYCTSLAATDDYGATWRGVSAPLTGKPMGSTGVSQLRFANLMDGWAYGPALFETTDGGAHWHKESTFGLRVVALETADGSAYAVFARCGGATADFAGDCTSFTLYTSADGGTRWTHAAVPPAFRTMSTTAASSASLTIAGNIGYLLGPSGQLLRGNLTAGTWTHVGSAQCEPGGAQASGLPAGAHLTTLGAPQTKHPTLVLACGANGSATIYTSAAGRVWTKAGVARIAGQATSLSSNATGILVLASTAGIYYSGNHGQTWQSARITGVAPPGGFSYVGMTTIKLGVAVPADAALREIFVTTDSGMTWQPSPIRS